MKKFLCLIMCLLILFAITGCKKNPNATSSLSSDLTNNNSNIIVIPYDDEDTSSVVEIIPSEPVVIQSETPTTAQNTDWKSAYLNYLSVLDLSYCEGFSLIYVDNNDIPELFIMGRCEADGEIICSYNNGLLTEHAFGRLYGTSYAEKSGLILHTNGNMGYYYSNLYELKSGVFTCLHESTMEEDSYDETLGDIAYKYTVDGIECDEATHTQNINSWTNGMVFKSTSANIVSYTEMVNLLKS